jgi:hypothetical protein
VNWKDLYIGAIRRPESVQVLLEHGLAAVEASQDDGLRREIGIQTATPFKLCAALDAHGVPVPASAAAQLELPAA